MVDIVWFTKISVNSLQNTFVEKKDISPGTMNCAILKNF